MRVPDPLPIEPLESPPDADVTVPGSKSITNRALVCAALATGTSRLSGVLLADDTEAMLKALDALGLGLRIDRDTAEVVVDGWGRRVPAGPATLDVRLSGTTARFLAPLLLLGSGRYVLDAAEPFRARPMGPAFDALTELGATVEPLQQPGHLPAAVSPPPRLATHHLDVGGDVSSQFLSGLLLVAPALPDGLDITVTTPLVSAPYVTLTLQTMRAFGADVEEPAPGRYRVRPTGYLATDHAIEPDASAASYFLAAAAITGGRVRIRGLTPDAGQGDVRFAEVLARMGAEVTHDERGLEVRGTGRLRGIEVDLADLSDTAQTLAAVAVFADGPTRVTGVGFIRRKETDRIAAVVTELQRLGIDAQEEPDGFVIRSGTPSPGVVATYDDHRMAMSFALLGLRVPGIRIADPGCVAKTFPTYFDALRQLRRSPHRERSHPSGPGTVPATDA